MDFAIRPQTSSPPMEKYNMAVSAAGMVLQIAINIKMVPAYGTLAVAVTSCVVYAFMAFTLLFIFIQQYYRNR